MIWPIALLGIFFIVVFYRRWIPVPGIKCAPLPKKLTADMVILDIRDYQEADRYPVKGAYTLPYPYLKRYLDTINSNKIFLVAPDKVSKNLSIRLLQKHGITVSNFAVVRGDRHASQPIKAHCS
ncbi:hypothetical protein ACE1TI_14260 [Alteribacillus sp. JSM 102045]|uniref:hypothetical protein n=1 Tax=Alteribacillus sp. JSM 102045 TaxID=1562101 RepID=UPI0035BEDF8D